MNLNEIKTIAIIGLSDKPDRPSFQVGQYLLDQGYKIIPINPNITESLGQKAYPNIASIPSEINIDIFDIFRKSEDVESIIQEIIDSVRSGIIWLQEGINNQSAVDLATSHGYQITSGLCLMKYHQNQKA